jgi:hypothetical protein
MTITFRFLDSILGLEPIYWEDRLITQGLKMAPSYTPIPNKPRPMPSKEILVGRYYDEGYGALEITDFNSPNKSTEPIILSPEQSTDSKEYFEAISKATTTQAGLSKPVLLAPINKLFGSAYVFTHFDGPLFNVSMVNVKQNKQGELAAYGGLIGTGVFLEGKGLGMFDNFWSGRHGKRAVEDDVQREAEVWFGKIQ